MINIEDIELHEKFTIFKDVIVWHGDSFDWDDMLNAEAEIPRNIAEERGEQHLVTKTAWEHLLKLESTPPRVLSDKQTPWGSTITIIERRT